MKILFSFIPIYIICVCHYNLKKMNRLRTFCLTSHLKRDKLRARMVLPLWSTSITLQLTDFQQTRTKQI